MAAKKKATKGTSRNRANSKAAKKKTAKKKTAKKASSKRPARKKTGNTPTASNGSTVTKAMTSKGLRKPQVRILQALYASRGNPLTRPQIAAKARVDYASLTEYIGAHDDVVRIKNDELYMPSLRSLKLVKVEQHDVDGKDTVVHTITAAGVKAAAKT